MLTDLCITALAASVKAKKCGGQKLTEELRMEAVRILCRCGWSWKPAAPSDTGKADALKVELAAKRVHAENMRVLKADLGDADVWHTVTVSLR